MYILGDEVVMQRLPRAALAAIATKTRQQRGFGLIQRGNQLAVSQRQIVKRRLALFFNVRIEEPGFKFQVVRQLFIAAGEVILQRANRKDKVPG
ncbi:hypothetical protein D3C71_1654560 [compost metagenome]